MAPDDVVVHVAGGDESEFSAGAGKRAFESRRGAELDAGRVAEYPVVAAAAEPFGKRVDDTPCRYCGWYDDQRTVATPRQFRVLVAQCHGNVGAVRWRLTGETRCGR